MDDGGRRFKVREIMLSPVGIHLDLVFFEPDYTDGIFKDFQMSLIMVDGTELPLEDGGGGGHWTEGDKKADADYYAEFDIPIPCKDIKAIVICGATYELNNTVQVKTTGEAGGLDLKKRRFPNIRNRADFGPSGKPFPFGSNLGQTGDWGGFEAIRGVIILGQLEGFVKEIRRFRNFYAAKTADSLVGVSGFEPEASWTRTKRDTKLRHTPITLLL